MDQLEFNNENPRLGIKETSPSERLNIGGQQTAVDWFYNAIQKNTLINLSTLYEQAKLMEKEQIENAYDKGAQESWDSEQYYNETYNK